MSLTITPGEVDVSIEIMIVDETTGVPETGVTTATAGLALQYRREGAANVAITEVALATPALTDPHLDGGFLEIGSGLYRLDLPDAAVAAGANSVVVHGTVTGMVVLPVRIQLETWEAEAGPTAQDIWEYATRTVDLSAVTNVLGTPTDTDLATDLANLPTAAENAAALLATALSISAPADGSAPTVAQALSLLMGKLGVFKLSRSSTTLTAYANDETTVLATWSLDDASAPTSVTRAS